MSDETSIQSRAQFNEERGLPGTVVLARMWRRVVAQLLDQLIVLIPVVAIALAVGVRGVDDITDHALVINIAVIATAFAYEFVMVGAWGRSLGKFALGTRVVRVDTGGPVLWYSAAIRALIPLAAGVIPGIGQILSLFVYVRAFLDPRHQGWHDRAAGTIVIAN
ncbi:MAG: RDD family protein [Ilumatobacteraceae bacterium]